MLGAALEGAAQQGRLQVPVAQHPCGLAQHRAVDRGDAGPARTGVDPLVKLAMAAVAQSWRWLGITFGVLFIAAGVLCFINPEATFAGFADMLGFLLVLVGVWWTVEALAAREGNPLWWLGFSSGILMILAAFWTSGQFFLHKAYTLLVIAGIWALLHGITDIVRAFQMRRVRERSA